MDTAKTTDEGLREQGQAAQRFDEARACGDDEARAEMERHRLIFMCESSQSHDSALQVIPRHRRSIGSRHGRVRRLGHAGPA
jgi:hypothetical protein